MMGELFGIIFSSEKILIELEADEGGWRRMFEYRFYMLALRGVGGIGLWINPVFAVRAAAWDKPISSPLVPKGWHMPALIASARR